MSRSTLQTLLEECARRVRRVRIATAFAVAGSAALVATVAFAAAMMQWVPADGVVTALRVLLYGALLVLLLAALWRRPSPAAVAHAVEVEVPALEGRLATWVDATTSARYDPHNPVLRRLGAETTALLGAAGPARAVPWPRLAWPSAATVLALGALLWFAFAAPLGWQLATQRLWAGNLADRGLPHIVVKPGDVRIPRGSDVTVRAHAEGFAGLPMRLNAAFAGSRFEEAPMDRTSSGAFELVLPGVRDGVDYFVTAGPVTSERFRIDVADVPQLKSLRLTLHPPGWTGMPSRSDTNGDVRALAGTRVEVEATTDPPLARGQLVLDGAPNDLAIHAQRASASFDVLRDGEWYLSALDAGTPVRISETFSVRVTPDAPPEIEFRMPGHDRSATAIEEVPLGFAANDDVRVDRLSLFWAVNGGAWNEAPLGADARTLDGEHLLLLEDLRVSEQAEDRPLRPGDLVSFYASAEDHSNTARTALYFLDVRPFDRSYREVSQATRAGSGNGNGMEIAERQRDIVTATWNLERERRERRRSEADLGDQAALLSEVQRTLETQVQTLIERAQGRSLDMDDRVSVIVEHLRLAAAAMDPAAERLAEVALDEALPPEQEALRHLLTAEASVDELDVSLSTEGAPGSAGRSLSELIELEMDPERNRYETAQSASPGQDEREDDAALKALEALAERQEQLADRARQQDDLPTSRWQLERLQRELAALRERLQSTGSASSRSSARDAALSRLQEAEQSAQAELERRQPDPDALARTNEALRDAADLLRGERREELVRSLRTLEQDAQALAARQRESAARLAATQNEALNAAREGKSLSDGLDDFERWELAIAKRGVREELAALENETNRLAESLAKDSEVREALHEALDELASADTGERLARAEDALFAGWGFLVASSESLVSDALERLARRLGDAASRAESLQPATDPAATALADIRTMRQALETARATEDGSNTIESIARDATELGASLGVQAVDSGEYRYRGLGAGHEQRLYELTLAKLDRLELELRASASQSVRTHPRDDDTDGSEAAARYFRALSCAGSRCPTD